MYDKTQHNKKSFARLIKHTVIKKIFWRNIARIRNKKSMLRFKNYRNQLNVSCLICTNYELSLKKIYHENNDDRESYREKYKNQTAFGNGDKVIRYSDFKYNKPVKIYTNEDTAFKSNFLNYINLLKDCDITDEDYLEENWHWKHNLVSRFVLCRRFSIISKNILEIL